MSSSKALLDRSPRTRAIRTMRQWIDDGAWLPGEPVPNGDLLAARLKVSRRTAQLAVRSLCDEGLLARSGKRILRQPPGHGRGGWLTRTICLITDYHQQATPQDEDRATGWSDRISLGAIQSLETAKRPFLSVSSEAALEVLASGPAAAILLDHDGARSEALRTALRRAADQGVAVCVHGDLVDWPEFDRVASDHAAGASALVAWLLGQGRRRLALVMEEPLDRPWFHQRRQGFEAALRTAGLVPAPTIAIPLFPPVANNPEAMAAAARVIAGHLVEAFSAAEPPDALLVCSDRTVYGVAAAIRLFGKEPHRDITLVGYDNYWRDCSEARVEPARPLATVDKDNRAIGAALVRLVDERQRAPAAAVPQLFLVPPRLIAST